MSFDVLELLHYGWAAFELDKANRERLFEICMDMLGYKYRWVEGLDVEDVGWGQLGHYRWVYYTEDPACHSDEEGSLEGSESSDADEEQEGGA
jgi:hypothetical protein